MAAGEAASYRFALESARQRGLTRAVKELERIGPPPYGIAETKIQRKWLGKVGGFAHQSSLPKLILKTILTTTEYTLTDFSGFGKGGEFSLSHLGPELMRVDFTAQVPRLEVPVYYILGRYDQTVPCELAADYFGRFAAPAKQLFWLEHSAHALLQDEPAEFIRVLRQIRRDICSQEPLTRAVLA